MLVDKVENINSNNLVHDEKDYKITKETIKKDSMEFEVINYYPKENKKSKKKEIEKQLFKIFSKYVM